MTLDRCLLQMLDRDLEDAEEQYGTALRGHLQTIDSLLDLQYARLRGLRQQFDSQLKARPALEAVKRCRPCGVPICSYQLANRCRCQQCTTQSLPSPGLQACIRSVCVEQALPQPHQPALTA